MFDDLFGRLGIGELNRGVSLDDEPGLPGGPVIGSTNPATGRPLPPVHTASIADYERVVDRACQRVSDLADGPAAAAGRGRPPDRRGPARAERPTWACWSPSRRARSAPRARARSRK